MLPWYNFYSHGEDLHKCHKVVSGPSSSKILRRLACLICCNVGKGLPAGVSSYTFNSL